MSFKKFIIAADNHGSMIHKESLQKLLAFKESWKPSIVVHLGDNWDFAPLRGGAGPEEKAGGLSEDFQAGISFLDVYKPNFLTLGNHDARIYEMANSVTNGLLREHCQGLCESAERHFNWASFRTR